MQLLVDLNYFKQILKAILMFWAAFSLVAIGSKQGQIIVSNSGSLPQRVFLRLPNMIPKLNNYSVVESAWYKAPLIKKIVGQTGDRLWYDREGQLLVNQQLIGKAYPMALDGRLLQPIKAQIIPEGVVFLAGVHERSFDSRYQELGLIAISELKGLVIPLF